MSTSIVVATDGHPGALGALRMAGWRAKGDGCRVEVLAVYEPRELYAVGYPEIIGSTPSQIASIGIETLRARVQTQLSDVGGAATTWPLTVDVGRVAPTIARFAVEKQAGLILLGLRQPGALERWLGREALLRLVHLAQIPILAVPQSVSPFLQRVIVAVDFSEFSLRAAREVVRWVAPGAYLHLVHVTRGPAEAEAGNETILSLKTYQAGAERQLQELAAELERLGHVATRIHVRGGDPGSEILQLAEEVDADLIAAGSHGAGFFGRIVMGSVSSKLAHGAQCALFIAPPAEAPAEILELSEREVLAELGTSGDLALSHLSAPAG